MKKFFVVLLSVVILCGGCVFAGNETTTALEFKAPVQIPENEINYVSEYRLIGSPKDFDGKKVRVVGYLKYEISNQYLYVSKDDCDLNITKNALWCNISPIKLKTKYENLKALNGKYVVIEGTFNGLNSGHTDLYSGAIENITLVREWK
ncbi:MAG: hypothetical protein ACI4VF_05115 [Lachnospirales bacterium]